MKAFLRSLHARMAALIFLVALPGAVLFSIQMFEQRSGAMNHVRQRAMGIVDLLALDQKRLIEDTRRYLRRLAAFPEVQKPDTDACGRFLARMLQLNNTYANLGVPGVDGELRCNALPLTRRVNVADRAYIRDTFTNRDFSIGEFQLDRAAGVSSVNFSYPVIDPLSNDLVGAAVAVVSLDWWSLRLDETGLPEGFIAYISDAENTISAFYPLDQNLLGLKADVLNLEVLETQTVPGYFITIARDNRGVKRIFVEKQLLITSTDNQISVTVGMPFDQTLGAIEKQFIQRIGLFAVFIIVMVALAFYGVRVSFINPVRKLSMLTTDLEAGKTIDDFAPSGGTELMELGGNFARMANTLQEIQKIAHIGSFEFIADTQETIWSDEECRIYGVDPARGSPAYQEMLQNFVHPDDADRLDRCFREALAHGEIYELEHRIIRPDGSVRIVHDVAHPYFDDKGSLYKYIGITQDVTERKQVERELREKEARFRMVFDQQFQFMAILSEDGVTQEINELPLRIQGISAQEYVGKPFWDAPAWSSLPQWQAIWRQRLQRARHLREPILTQDVYQTTEGSIRYADASTLALRTPEGRVSGFLIQATDTTERHLAEEQAKDTERVLSSVFQLMRDLFFLLDSNGKILDYRAKETSDFHVSPDVFLGKTMQEVLPPEVGELFAEKLKGVESESPVSFEYALPMAGEERYYETRLANLPESRHCIAIVRDITSRKHDEMELADQLEELRRWYDATLGREGRVLELKREINAMAEEFGQPPPYPSARMDESHD